MPCTYDFPGSSSYSDTQELDKLTRMLCGLCSTLTDKQIGKVPELSAWWADHKKRDEARRERERKELQEAKDRAKALSKLTTKERKLLGVK